MKQTATWDLVVIGGAYTDYVVQGPEIPEQGETTLGNKFLNRPALPRREDVMALLAQQHQHA